MTRPLFELRNIRHCYHDHPVLEEEHLDLYPETITGLAGPNGSGKSTLINILALILKPSEGTLHFMGQRVSPFSEIARGRIAALTQDSCLLKRSVFSNVAYGLKVRKDAENLEKRVAEALETVGLDPSVFARRTVQQLSGGEAKRVALAARLILKPQVLLLDEPTAHVDEHSSAMILQAILMAREQWKTTLVISNHDREWLDNISDRTITLFKGRLFKEQRVNILSGPWVRRGERWYKTGDSPRDAEIPVPMPPDEISGSAILPASALFLAREKSHIPENALAFPVRITGLSIARNRDCLFVTVACHNSRLVSMIKISDAPSYFPGQILYAFYFPESLSFR